MENLYSPGQKIMTKKGKDNWSRTFGKSKVGPDQTYYYPVYVEDEERQKFIIDNHPRMKFSGLDKQKKKEKNNNEK